DEPHVADNLGTGVVAITTADVHTLTAAQVKGRVVAIEEPTEHDMARVAQHAAAFMLAVSETDGTPVDILRRLLPTAYVACELVVTEAYDQSPGPTAGAARAISS